VEADEAFDPEDVRLVRCDGCGSSGGRVGVVPGRLRGMRLIIWRRGNA
jgi:hypothetical protein